MKKLNKILIFAFLSIFGTANIFALESAIMMREGGTLWRQNDKGEIYWENKVSRTVPAGTPIEIERDKAFTATYVSSSGRKTADFYPAKFDGNDFFVFTSHVALGEITASVISKATLYTFPKLSAFRNAILEPGTLVVTGTDEITQNGIKFMEVQFFDTSAWLVKTRYVLASKLSYRTDDIEGARLLGVFYSSAAQSIKREMISTALDLKLSGELPELVKREYEKIFLSQSTSSENETDITSLPDVAKIVISYNGEEVNVYAAPDIESKVVKTVADGTEGIATQMIEDKVVIDEVEENWFFVATSKFSGWIFGGNLSNSAPTETNTDNSENNDELIF